MFISHSFEVQDQGAGRSDASHGREKNHLFGVSPYEVTGQIHEALFS